MKESLGKIRILVVDTDSIASNKLAGYLRESGFDVKSLNNSDILPKTILEWRPHVLFIDLLFPGYYAQKCLQFLEKRNLLGDDGVRVIVTSKHNAELNVVSCLTAGADDFLSLIHI